ncbi:MAG: Calx-beta domain-containing protein [Gaiellaceae bacterium]
MKVPRTRLVQCVTVLAGVVLLGVLGLGVSASAGASSSGMQELSALRGGPSAFPSSLALSKSGKLSSRLRLLSQPSALKASTEAQATLAGLPQSGPGSLLRTGDEQLIVYVRPSGSFASAREAVESVGATILNSSARAGVLTVSVSPSRLQALGKLATVAAAWEALAPIFSSACPSGAVVSEGDSQLAAYSARSTYAVDGSGVTVGILSDSFDDLGGASSGVSAAELPGTGNPCGYTTPLDVLAEDFTGLGLDEGRAMLEIVHDLAPGAALAFATANGTEANPGMFGMADNIRALRDAGARVIADDVTFFAEPMFQKGPIDTAIDDVTSSGVSYFSSAGNSNLVVGGNDVGSYEAPAYRPTPCPTELNAWTEALGSPFTYLDCHDFDPAAGVDDNGADYTLDDGGYLTIDLQWAEPWSGVNTDLDVFLIDAATGAILDYSWYENSGTAGIQEPFEYMGYHVNDSGAPEDVKVVIARYSGTSEPRLKYVITRGADVASAEYDSSSGGDVVGPTIFGHNGGQNTVSMAAVPYYDSTIPEDYSSHGPVTHYFGPVSGTTPAAALSSPFVLPKPDIAATDCAQTSFFYDDGLGSPFSFCGTSAAVPHAAAVAALMFERYPALTPSQILARLKSTANEVTDGGTSDVVGSGLIDALAAVGISTPIFAFSQPSYSVSEAGPSATITINRSGDKSTAVSVHVATASGTAKAGSDYTSISQDVSFAVDETTKTISIPIIDDHTVEGSQTLSVTLSSPSGGELGQPSTAVLTIVDNERSFAFNATSYSVGEGAGSAPITITRSGSTTAPDSVHFATADDSAKAGSNYSAVSQDVSFAVGETAKTVSVPVIDDDRVNSDHTVSLSLSLPSAGTTLGSPHAATLTIGNNDALFSLGASTDSFKESVGSVTVTIYRSGYVADAASVHVATVNGTAIAGKDYKAISQTIAFLPNEKVKTVNVPIINDKVLEGRETFKLTLSSPSANGHLGGSLTLTIINSPGKITLAKLTRKTFSAAQARKVKLAVTFAPASGMFNYLLSIKKGTKWVTVRSVKKRGNFAGKKSLTVKSLFGKKAIKHGRYRVKLIAAANSKTPVFKVT